VRHDIIQASAQALDGAHNLANGGSVRAQQSSPKLGLVVGPFAGLGQTEFYANWGHGFHSNDVRGATARVNPQDGSAAEAVPLMVKARGSELGLRLVPLPGWHSKLAVWQMALASELVFVGDEGVTEPRGASHRRGVEWSNALALAGGWRVEADLAVSKARFNDAVNGGHRVPNAIPLTASLGLSFDDGGPWFGGLRWRYLGAYDLEESGREKSTAFWIANLKTGYRLHRDWQVTLDVLNLLNKQANDIEYWGGACTRQEAVAGTAGCGSGSPLDGRLVHPVAPRSWRLGVRLSF
jgi:outer membrane receptor protein involved in Fe transport